MTSRYGVIAWAGAVFMSAGLLVQAGTVRWGNTAASWGTGGNWVGGSAPTANDQAYFPNAAAGIDPDVSGVHYAVTNLYADVGGTKKYSFNATGGGSLTVSGTPGVTFAGAAAAMSWHVRVPINLGRPSSTSTQAWDFTGANNARFLAPIGGTGTLWLATATGFTYSNAASCLFRGNFVMDNSRNTTRTPPSSSIWWDLLAGGNANFSFGRSADGSQAGTWVLGSTLHPFGVTGGASAGPKLQFCPYIKVNGITVNASLDNSLRTVGFGGNFSWAPKRAPSAGAAGSVSAVRLGRVFLNAPLYFSSDAIDQGAPGTALSAHLYLTNGVTLCQQAPATLLIQGWRRQGSSDVHFSAAIADGAGPYRNPLVLQPLGMIYAHSTNTHAWGTVVDQTKSGGGSGLGDNVLYVTTGRMGSGPMTILPGGAVRMDNTNAVPVGQTIDVQGSPIALGALFAYDDRLAERISPSSSGIFMFRGTSSASLKSLLDAAGPGLGNGHMFLGSSPSGVGTATFDGSSFKVGADGVYRLCGGMRGDQGGDQLILDRSASTVGVLTGTNRVQIGSQYINCYGPVWFRDANDFTGTLTIRSPWLNPLLSQLRGDAMNTTTTPGASPTGSAAGEMELIGGNFQLVQHASVTSHVAKAKVTAWSESQLDVSAPNRFTKFATTDLVLTNRAALLVYFRTVGAVQRQERIVVLNEPAMSNGMVDPHIIAVSNNILHFAAYDTGSDANGEKGFRGAASSYTVGLPNPGNGTQIADVTADPAVANQCDVYAARWGDFNVTGAGTITNRSGGMLWPAPTTARTFAPNLDFVNKEAFFYVGAQTVTLNGRVTGSDGLTKNGAGTLYLTYTNPPSSLSGRVTVNRGILDVIFDRTGAAINGSLGTVTDIYLNGGTLRVRNPSAGANQYTTLYSSRTITIGPLGGGLGRGGSENNTGIFFPGRITGPGCLYVSISSGNTWAVLQNANNDWEGGTQLVNGDNVGLRVVRNAKVGKGPILIARGSRLRIEDNENLKWPGLPSVYLPVQVAMQGLMHMPTNAPVMGSLSGAGIVMLGDAAVNPAVNSTLTVGLDDGSSSWYGCIVEAYNSAPRLALGSLVKAGTGTWSLHGAQDYRGATVVTNGTLNLMGSVRGDANVGPTGTLRGSGLVKGNLTLNGGTFGIELSNTAQPLHVNGALTINPGSELDVSLASGFSVGATPVTVIETSGGVTGLANVTVGGGLSTRVVGGSLAVARSAGTMIILR